MSTVDIFFQFCVNLSSDNIIKDNEGLFGFVGFHHSSPYFHYLSLKICGSHGEGACLDGFWGFVSITQFSPNRVMSY